MKHNEKTHNNEKIHNDKKHNETLCAPDLWTKIRLILHRNHVSLSQTCPFAPVHKLNT